MFVKFFIFNFFFFFASAHLLDGLLQELLEDPVLVDARLVEPLQVDELDPDDALDSVGGEGGELPVAVLDQTVPQKSPIHFMI